MPRRPVTGMLSTHGDRYQLNTTTLIRHAARSHPEQQIVYRSGSGDWDTYTYGAAYDRIKQAANVLTGLGAGPADVIGVLDWNSRRHFELYWAIPGIAAVLLQMNLRLGTDDLVYVTNHSGASIILVDETMLSIAEAIAPLAPGVRTWVVMSDRPMSDITTTLPNAVHFEELMASARTEFDWPVIDEHSAYSACYTTGTTGRPKGVYYSHRGIYLHTMAQASVMRMTPSDCVMLITPMFHANCWGLPQSAIYVAAKVILPGRYAADEVGQLVATMAEHDVTVANGAPVIFAPILDHIQTLDSKPDFRGARFLSGSTEPSLALMRGFHEATGAEIIHAYGATETTPLATINTNLKPSLQTTLSEDQKWDLKRCQGVPMNGVDIKLVDADGNELPHDGVAQGEILLRGPWITDRYHDMADNADRFSDGWWRSGDVGRIEPNGYLKLTDRIKDIVKSGGEWISSIDMENAIVGHPRVAEAAVVGVPHPQWQERPVAVIVTVDGGEVELEEIHSRLRGSFAGWQLPDTVLRVAAIPRTSVGKVDKLTMRAQYADIYTQAR